MHVNWSLCMKLYISAPKDMEQAARMFIEVRTYEGYEGLSFIS